MIEHAERELLHLDQHLKALLLIFQRVEILLHGLHLLFVASKLPKNKVLQKELVALQGTQLCLLEDMCDVLEIHNRAFFALIIKFLYHSLNDELNFSLICSAVAHLVFFR